jgi:DNA-binding NtrC family response regulator
MKPTKPTKIKILIAEDNEVYSNAIKRILQKMLESLDLKVEFDFYQSTTLSRARARIKEEVFALIILDGQLDNKKPSLLLTPDIKQHNAEAIVCLISSNPMLVEKAKINTDIRIMCFNKDISALNGYSGIIRPEDLEEIRKTFMLKHKHLLGIPT